MDNEKILQFPSTRVREWTRMESMLRAEFKHAGFTSGCIDFVCSRLRADYEQTYSEISVQIPEKAIDSVNAISERHHQSYGNLFMRLAGAYVELYRALYG